MKVFPAVHYSMGGLWVDYEASPDGFVKPASPRNHQTNLPGLFAVGECEYQYHGANRLGANSLLSCIYAGMIGGPAGVSYAGSLKTLAEDVPSTAFDRERKKWEDRFAGLGRMDGPENPYKLHQELGEWMNENVTIVRENAKLRKTADKLVEIQERFGRVRSLDPSGWTNATLVFLNQLWNMIELGKVVVAGALARDESRGAHYKPEFPKRDDENWLKTTIAEWTPTGPRLSYEPVDISLQKPVERKYD
jgi:succinate dehydrogenase / fumarate reductase flavoprotein subunit